MHLRCERVHLPAGCRPTTATRADAAWAAVTASSFSPPDSAAGEGPIGPLLSGLWSVACCEGDTAREARSCIGLISRPQIESNLMSVPWTAVIAAYAAGVSTVVGLSEILRELPSVRVYYERAGKILTDHGRPLLTTDVLWIANRGRRPVIIENVGFVDPLGDAAAELRYFETIELSEGRALPLRLGEGDSESFLVDTTVPQSAFIVVRDRVGRWWPRRRRIRMRVRWWRVERKRRSELRRLDQE
jgi:hypothetical protein